MSPPRTQPRGRRLPALGALLSLALLAGVVSGCRPAGTTTIDGATLPAGVATISRPLPRGRGPLVESPSSRFITDRGGRVLVLRGENVLSAAKARPYDGGLTEPLVAALSADFGFTVSRHLILWAGIEPTKGVYDEDYFARLRQKLDWYAKHGVRVFLDMHQDIYSEVFGGDGAPEWAVFTDGIPFTPTAGGPWWLAVADPAVQRAYRNFWDPERGHGDLQEHYIAAMTEVARRFGTHPAVLGYDLMNEPGFARGDLAKTVADARVAQTTGDWRDLKLIAFEQRLVDSIRTVDRDNYIFYEPSSLIGADLDLGGGLKGPFPSDLAPLHDPRDGPARLVYAPHLYSIPVDAGSYDPTTNRYVGDWERLRPVEASGYDSALFIGEFGAGPTFTAWFRDILAMADRQMAGFTYWSYDAGGWGITNPDGSDAAHAREIARPYPQAVAGVPRGFSFDPESRRFRLDYRTRPGVRGPTEIYVGARRHYPSGWQVSVSGGRGRPRLRYDRTKEVLLVDAAPSSRPYTVCITPPGGTCPPAAS